MSGIVVYRGRDRVLVFADSQASAPGLALNVNKTYTFPSVPGVACHSGYHIMAKYLWEALLVSHVRTPDQFEAAMQSCLDDAGERLIHETGDPIAGTLPANSFPGEWADHWIMATPDRVGVFKHHSRHEPARGTGEYTVEHMPQGLILTTPAYNGAYVHQTGCEPSDQDAMTLLAGMRKQNPDLRMGGDVVRWSITADKLVSRVIGTLPPTDEDGADGDFERHGDVIESGPPVQTFARRDAPAATGRGKRKASKR